MKQLQRRLRKLEERTIFERSWNDRVIEFRQVAMSKLSTADRSLFEAATSYTIRVPAESEVWERWNSAFAIAATETGFRFAIRAEQWMW
jgi:hypothetical protein